MSPQVGLAYIFGSIVNHQGTANPTWGDIFECCFKTQSSKLESLFSLKRVKRDRLILSSYLSKMSPEVVYFDGTRRAGLHSAISNDGLGNL